MAGPGEQKSGGWGFGQGSSLKTDLVGIMYDFKQTRDGKDMGGRGTGGDYYKILKECIDHKFDPSYLANELDIFTATNKIYSSHILIPFQDAENGPKAFGLENVIKPRGWIIRYVGVLNPEKSGKYRFVGHFDDMLIVSVGKSIDDMKVILEAGWGRERFGKAGVDRATNWKPSLASDDPHSDHAKYTAFPGGNEVLGVGDWIDLEHGENWLIEIIVGERPGGKVGGGLLIERYGDDYEKDNRGRKILPPFITYMPPDENAFFRTNDLYQAGFNLEIPGKDDPLYRYPIMNSNLIPKTETKEKKNNDVSVSIIRK